MKEPNQFLIFLLLCTALILANIIVFSKSIFIHYSPSNKNDLTTKIDFPTNQITFDNQATESLNKYTNYKMGFELQYSENQLKLINESQNEVKFNFTSFSGTNIVEITPNLTDFSKYINCKTNDRSDIKPCFNGEVWGQNNNNTTDIVINGYKAKSIYHFSAKTKQVRTIQFTTPQQLEINLYIEYIAKDEYDELNQILSTFKFINRSFEATPANIPLKTWETYISPDEVYSLQYPTDKYFYRNCVGEEFALDNINAIQRPEDLVQFSQPHSCDRDGMYSLQIKTYPNLQFKTPSATPGYKLTTKNINVGNINSKYYYFEYVASDPNFEGLEPYSFINVYVPKGDKTIVISFGDLENIKTFDQILSTIKFINHQN